MSAENFGRYLKYWRNGDRSNYRYSQFNKTFNQYGQSQILVDFKKRQFQPRKEIRDMIASTYFYMQDEYNINLSDAQSNLMIAWDKMYRPNEWECDRNRQIERI